MFSLTLKVYLSEKLKIIIIEFYKIVKILRAPWLVKKQPLIAPINPWKIEVCVIKVTDGTFYRFTNLVNVSRCWETIRKKKTKVNQSPPARNYKLFEADPSCENEQFHPEFTSRRHNFTHENQSLFHCVLNDLTTFHEPWHDADMTLSVELKNL